MVIFSNGAMLFSYSFFRAQLQTMFFQWFCYPLTIIIECFFYRFTFDINGFSIVFPNSDTMVNDGFGCEKTKLYLPPAD